MHKIIMSDSVQARLGDQAVPSHRYAPTVVRVNRSAQSLPKMRNRGCLAKFEQLSVDGTRRCSSPATGDRIRGSPAASFTRIPHSTLRWALGRAGIRSTLWRARKSSCAAAASARSATRCISRSPVEKSCPDVIIVGNTFCNGGRGPWINQPCKLLLADIIFVNNTTKCERDPRRGRKSFLTDDYERYAELHSMTQEPGGPYGNVTVRRINSQVGLALSTPSRSLQVANLWWSATGSSWYLRWEQGGDQIPLHVRQLRLWLCHERRVAACRPGLRGQRLVHDGTSFEAMSCADALPGLSAQIEGLTCALVMKMHLRQWIFV